MPKQPLYPHVPKSQMKKGGSPPKPTRDDVRVEVWEERDRLHIGIQIKDTGDYYMSWWDDDARQMFKDGFFKRKPKLEESVLAYAEEMGILARKSSSVAPGEGPKYPDYIMAKVRQHLGLEEDDTSRDAEINRMSPNSLFDHCLEWEGIIGYGGSLRQWINDIYGVSLG